VRRSDWDSRLSGVVRDNRKRPHQFGQWDCLLWPAAAVKAVTGKDFGRGHRGKYRSVASAYRYLGTLGFTSTEAYLDSVLPQKPVGFAQKGDLVLVRTATGNNPGVCMGAFALVVGEDGTNEGLVRVPRAHWLKAWAV